jgi:hypothetical protein
MKVASINEAFVKRDNIAWFASHRHSPEGNEAYQYSYLYKYEINLPEGVRYVVLPNNPKIKIFAVTAANNPKDDITPLQPLYDDFSDNKPVKLRVNEIITPDLKPLNFNQVPLFTGNLDARMLPRVKQYLRNAGLDTVVTVTLPSADDYAEINSGNKATAVYYPYGKSSAGIEYSGQKIDISGILDSKKGDISDTLFFDNGEGRIVIDLQKPVPIDRINIFFESARAGGRQGLTQDASRSRGQRIFSIWAATSEADPAGNPVTKGWQYAGAYGAGGVSTFRSQGISYIFSGNLACRYIMLITDQGTWHGSDYIKHIDIFKK